MTKELVCSICKKPMIPAPEDEGCWVLDCTCHNHLLVIYTQLEAAGLVRRTTS